VSFAGDGLADFPSSGSLGFAATEVGSGFGGGPPGCGGAVVREGGGVVSTGEAGWRSALFANPNTLSAMRTLTKSHTTILISDVFTWAPHDSSLPRGKYPPTR
jgi:hypothetical protein